MTQQPIDPEKPLPTLPRLYSVKDCLAALPVVWAERKFRERVIALGCHRGRGRQMFLTEGDFALFLDSLRPAWTEINRRRGRVPTKPSKAYSPEAAKALEAIRALVAKKTDARER